VVARQETLATVHDSEAHVRDRLEQAPDYLILNFDKFRDRTDSFFKTLNESKSHRLLFMEDPVGVVQKMVFPEKATPRFQLDDANRLLFAILSNAAFMKWAEGYQAQLEAEAVKVTKNKDKSEALREMVALFDKRKLYGEVAAGITETIDVETTLGVMYGVGTGGPFRRPAPIDHRRPADEPWDTPDIILIETLILAIDIYVAFGCVFIGRELPQTPDGGGLSRLDLRKISSTLAKDIRDKAAEIRASGVLGPGKWSDER
jgi:hypothetical protein